MGIYQLHQIIKHNIMNNTYIKLTVKYTILSVIMAVLWILSIDIAMGIFGVEVSTGQENPGKTILLLLLAAAINTGVIFALITKTRWSGWKLVSGISIVIFGIQFFMSQIEALYFNRSLGMPIELIYAVIFAGILLAVSFSIISVIILGKWKSETKEKDNNIPLNTSFIIKLVFLAVIVYPMLYFCAGYFIAWQLPELRILYSGSDAILPFFQHFLQTFTADPLFYPFQILRGFLWIGIATIIMKSLKAKWETKAFLVGLAFALIMNAQLLIPNPSMSESIRLYHFIETASSNFIWGYIIVWLLEKREPNNVL